MDNTPTPGKRQLELSPELKINKKTRSLLSESHNQDAMPGNNPQDSQLIQQIAAMFSTQDAKIENGFKTQYEESQASEKRLNEHVASQVQKIEEAFGTRITALESENAKLKSQNEDLSHRITRLEEDNRRYNVVVTGLKAKDYNEARSGISNMIKESGKPNVNFGNVRLIRTKSEVSKIVITCRTFEDKLQLMRNKVSYKTSDGNPIFLNDDLTPRQSEIQFKVRAAAKTLRAEGKSVKTRNGCLKVEDGPWLFYKEDENKFVENKKN